LKRKIARCIGSVALFALAAGCNNPKEEFGKTYYLDGAGNWGFGVTDVPAGLQAAGYPGDIEVYVWTTSFSPAIDQVNIIPNKLRAAGLTGKIKDYLTRFPSNRVNLIALSAGTGIAVWAVEGLPDGMSVENLILLGSSLSYNYDMREALRHIRGKVYVFHSGHDEVLTTAVRALGTVDRTNEDSAGLVGLRPPGGGSGKIVNVGWSARYTQYGWTGAHTDATSQAFVQAVVAPLVAGGQRRADGADRVTWMTPIGPELAAPLP
jgi:pimeloyl-ACP methyl ester carboxylesterase